MGASRGRRASFLGAAAAGALLIVGLVPGAAQADQPGALPAQAGNRPVCAPPVPATAACASRVITDPSGQPLATKSPSGGYVPADLENAYAVSGSITTAAGTGPTVAVVDAYDNPNAASDLLAYRKAFGLPLCSGGTVSCLFTKINQSGVVGSYPRGNSSWGREIDLDTEMVSAMCPQCKILLVEASSNSFANLGAAVDQAALSKWGAKAISNSYGGSEFSSEGSSTYDGHYNHPGIAVTVSSGDNGYGVEFPAASEYVTAVGGTSLKQAANSRGWTETAWSGAGSGCSAYIAKPGWQTAGVTGCSHRMVADVSAVADPYTGVDVYDSYGSHGGANWYVFGGTSVASPIVASVYALDSGTWTSTVFPSGGNLPYANASSGNLNDVVSGSNGSCGGSALCTAGIGWDGPTGLGTPEGASAF